MTTATQTTTEDWSLVDLNNADEAPIPAAHRRAVILAVIACATEHDGKVHASWVRPLLPSWVRDHTRGGVMSGLASAGVLASTGDTLPSGDRRNRNSKRPLWVYRVADWDRLRAEVA